SSRAVATDAADLLQAVAPTIRKKGPDGAAEADAAAKDLRDVMLERTGPVGQAPANADTDNFRAALVRAAGAVAGPDALDFLLELTRDTESPATRQAAVLALGSLGDRRATP